MDKQDEEAMLHQQAQQRQAESSQTSGGFSSIVDDIRHKVVEEPYWLRPEGREVTDDIAPSMRDFYESPAAQESNEPDYTPEQTRAACEDFFDMEINENWRDDELQKSQEMDRDIGL